MPGTTLSGGRNRLSAKTHEKRGTYRRSRHGVQDEAAVVPSGPVEKPTGLSAKASAVWDRLAPLVTALGTLTPADRPAFATLCELLSTLEAASAQKDREDFRLVSPLTGRAHPAVKLERDTATAVRPYLEMFGLTRTSRARLNIAEPTPADDNPLAKFLNRPRSKWPELR